MSVPINVPGEASSASAVALPCDFGIQELADKTPLGDARAVLAALHALQTSSKVPLLPLPSSWKDVLEYIYTLTPQQRGEKAHIINLIRQVLDPSPGVSPQPRILSPDPNRRDDISTRPPMPPPIVLESEAQDDPTPETRSAQTDPERQSLEELILSSFLGLQELYARKRFLPKNPICSIGSQTSVRN